MTSYRKSMNSITSYHEQRVPTNAKIESNTKHIKLISAQQAFLLLDHDQPQFGDQQEHLLSLSDLRVSFNNNSELFNNIKRLGSGHEN